MSNANNQIPESFDTEIIAGNIKNAMGKGEGEARIGKKNDMWMVKVSSLTIMDDFNVRSKNEAYFAKVREIADSIKANGFYSHKPFACLVMKNSGDEVIAVYDGHTRYDGLQLAISEGAAVERVPVVVAPAGTTLEDITVGLVTNNSGDKLEPLALGVVCKRLIGYGLDNTTIAKRLGMTPAYVGSLLSLIGAPKKIRDMVSDGKVAATLAVDVLRSEGEHAVAVLESGFETAKVAGKTKVTKKNIVKQSAVTAPRKPTVLELGLDWINNNGQMDSSYALLSAITGMTVEELKNEKMTSFLV